MTQDSNLSQLSHLILQKNRVLDTKIDEESQLSFYQENIKEWTQYYNDPDRLRAFSKIEEWYSLWDDRLKLETCMKDPKRLGNFKVNNIIIIYFDFAKFRLTLFNRKSSRKIIIFKKSFCLKFIHHRNEI